MCRRNAGGAVAEATSPRKSPLKKKIRRQGLSPRAFIDTIQGHQSDDDHSSVEDQIRGRTLFGGGNESEDEDFQSKDGSDRNILGINHAENAALALHATNTKSVGEERNWCSLCGRRTSMHNDESRLLHDKIASLEAQLKELLNKRDQCTNRSSSTVTTQQREEEQDKTDAAMGTGTPCETSPVGEHTNAMLGTTGTYENSTIRKHRVRAENAQISQELSNLIDNFVMNSTATADKNRFRRSRLAAIIVDSVISFPWTHRCIQERASALEKNSPALLTTATSTNQNDRLLQSLSILLNKNLPWRGNKSKASILIDCIWNADASFLDGEAKSCMVERVRCHIRRNVFTPAKILKAMDLAGFNLSLAGLETLRRVETDNQKYCRGFLPSKSSILRAARKVEQNADALCPFKMIGRLFENADEESSGDADFGEGFEFDVVKTVRTLLDAFGLTEEAKNRCIELCLTSDGAQLTHTLSHVAAGLKLNDFGLRDPLTKLLMLLHMPDSLVQSRNLCFLLRLIIAKDSKATLEGFRDLYGMFRNNYVSDCLQCQPFQISFPADMKLQWNALDEGGAAKVKEEFCYICPCRSSTLHIPQDKSKCQICIDRGYRVLNATHGNDEEEIKCYHYEFVSCPQVRSKLQEELSVLTAAVHGDDMRDEENRSSSEEQRMYVREPGAPAIDGDMLDIDFTPESASAANMFSCRITDELASRSMDMTGALHVRQHRLRRQLVIEKREKNLRQMLLQSEPKEKAMYLVLQAVPCILHLENRVGLKSIESVLRSGLTNALQGKLEWVQARAIQKRQDEFVARVTKIIQTQILGSNDAPSQWRFPLAEDGSMGSLSMDNNRTRCIINELELLIQVCFPDSNANKRRLLRCFPRYRDALKILRKNTDYTEDEVEEFQEHIDAWFCDWVAVYGREGCTNYTHLLSSSHIMRYMIEWKCLYRYSQQGWEALNALIKAYFFRRTNRGGFAGKNQKKSKLLGIARWLQRRIMWYSGHGDALFHAEAQFPIDSSATSDSDNEYDDDRDNNGEDDGDHSQRDELYSCDSDVDYDDDDWEEGLTF